jgi:hypothetical protein
LVAFLTTKLGSPVLGLENLGSRIPLQGAVCRKILFVICVLGTSCTASAQNNAASWQNLNALRVGEKIQVLERNSTKVSGTFLDLSDGTISVQQEAGSQAIQRQDVLSVKLMKNKHRLRNAFIGAGIGAGLGAALGGATNNGFVSRGVFAAGVGAAFSVPGAVVGALVPDHTTIYNASSH